MATEGTALLEQPPVITIETERLVLTTLQMSDLDDLKPIYSSHDVMKWATTGPLTTQQQAERWLSARALGPNVFQFCVRLRPTSPSSSPGPTVGILGSFHLPKCGYLFHPGYHGQGYATEALRAFIGAYFTHIPSPSASSSLSTERPEGAAPAVEATTTGGYDYLEAWTDVENAASQGVLRKCGFRRGDEFANEIELPVLGVRSSVVWHLARPGRTLEALGVGTDGVVDTRSLREREEGVVPPVQ